MKYNECKRKLKFKQKRKDYHITFYILHLTFSCLKFYLFFHITISFLCFNKIYFYNKSFLIQIEFALLIK